MKKIIKNRCYNDFTNNSLDYDLQSTLRSPRTHSSYLVWLIFCLNFGTGQWKPRKTDHGVLFISATQFHWRSIAGLEVYPWKQMIGNISEINFEIYIIISLGKMGMRSESRKKLSHSMPKARRDSWWAERKEVDGGDTCNVQRQRIKNHYHDAHGRELKTACQQKVGPNTRATFLNHALRNLHTALEIWTMFMDAVMVLFGNAIFYEMFF